MSKSLLERGWIWILIAITVDFFAGFILDYITELSRGEIIVIIFVSNILVLEMRHHHVFSMQVAATEKERARIFYRRDDTLKMAESIQHRALSSINAMWTQMPLDHALKDYFNRTLSDASGKDIHTTRLIDIARVPIKEIIEHIDDSWSYLERGDYRIVFIVDAPFEMIFTDNLEGIFFSSQRPSYVTLAITSPETQFVTKISKMFETVIVSGSKEFKASDFPRCDLDKIEVWVKDAKKELLG